uniref:Ribonuclease A-domain domain-containing protein n=1 Tax=Labrus bergylta TaxID=56723 RepID=A0A3Q3G258_9LABR
MGLEVSESQSVSLLTLCHVVGKMGEDDCTAKMNDKHRDININYCKGFNTFIVSPGLPIKTMGGKNNGEVTSPDTFNTIECKLQQGSKHPDCGYLRGTAVTKRITVTCFNGYPMHYGA